VDSHPGVFTERRGKGLMGALRCVQPNSVVVDALRADGLLAIAGGENVVRLLPPLIVTERQIDEAVAIIASVAGKLSQEESSNRGECRQALAKCL
jgi:acetylornithine/N-succinyldiaminopimelate aminotransferase